MGLQNRGLLGIEATVFHDLLKWLKFREKEEGKESPDRELSEATLVSVKNWADIDQEENQKEKYLNKRVFTIHISCYFHVKLLSCSNYLKIHKNFYITV